MKIAALVLFFGLFYLNCFSQILVPQQNHGIVNIMNGDIEFINISNESKGLIISGRRTESGSYDATRSFVYRRSGVDYFTHITNYDLPGLFSPSICVGDVNGDGLEDFFIMGIQEGNWYLADIYINRGNELFERQMQYSFVGLSQGSARFIDLDGDGDLDLIYTGAHNNVGKVYTYYNDGQGNFTQGSDTVFLPAFWGSIDVADVDGDGDMDILMSGRVAISQTRTYLYINDGVGGFTIDSDNSFAGQYMGQANFVDLNNDGFLDIVVVGSTTSSGQAVSKCYMNNGDNVFVDEGSRGLFPLNSGISIAYTDLNNDGYTDAFICGTFDISNDTSFLYMGSPSGFIQDLDFIGPNLSQTKAIFGNINGKCGDELIVCGYDRVLCAPRTHYFKNTNTNPNNCIDGDNEEDEIDRRDRIYPNPASDHVSVDLRTLVKYYYIVDENGRIVIDEQTVDAESFDFSVASLEKGIYYVVLKVEDRFKKMKLIVVR